MSDEIRLAFAHPSERAAASSPSLPDRISVRDMVVEVEIGAFQAERGTTQRVRFNIVVEVLPWDAPLEDDVDRILSYDRVTEAIEAELSAERLALLETLADRIASRILAEPQAARCFVRIEKLDRGPGDLGVEIVRSRDKVSVVEEEVPHPQVVFLTNEAMHSPHLSTWLDRISQEQRAVILCVGPSDTATPTAAHKMVQRRVDLLGIEQNAWVLAGLDERCVVVGTRTELDWGLKNGQISVWAPSKMVLDSVESPSANPKDALALVAWFASEMKAKELIVIGAEAPSAGPCPMRSVGVEVGALDA